MEVPVSVQATPASFLVRYHKVLPALSFLAGFIFDIVSFGRVVKTSSLILLLAYWCVAFFALMFLGRGVSSPWQSRLTWLVQFCFGSLFSASVIFYFKSSGSILTMLLVVVLLVLLVANELLKSRYARLGLSLSLFCLSGSMFANFIVPHWIHHIGFFWFLVSCALAFTSVVIVWLVSGRSGLVMIGPSAISLFLVSAYILHLIPPVPLVMKQSIVCKSFARIDGEYTCLASQQTMLANLGFEPKIIYQNGEEPIQVLTSIYAPTEVQAELEHRWEWQNPQTNKWIDKGHVRFAMEGGRRAGWRMYSNRKACEAGQWRVETAVPDGAVLGSVDFNVPASSEPLGWQYKREILK